MKYRFEHCGNPEYVEVHVSVELLEADFMHDAYSPCSDADKLFWEHMQGVTGTTEISIRKYSVSGKRAACFSKEEVLQSLLERIVIHLKVSGVDPGELEQLPTYREDIAITRCQACVEEEELEIARDLKDFETTDY